MLNPCKWNLWYVIFSHAFNTDSHLQASNHLIYIYVGPAGGVGISGVVVWECGECPDQYRLVQEPLGPDCSERCPTGGGQYTECAGRLCSTGPAPSQEEEDGAPGMAINGNWNLSIYLHLAMMIHDDLDIRVLWNNIIMIAYVQV